MNKESKDLIQVLDVEALISPTQPSVPGRDQAGQEEQDPQTFEKQQLIFPSGEELPRCWIDADYRESSSPN